MWDLIVSVPDHCLSFYFVCKKNTLGLGNKSQRREWTLHLGCLAGAQCTTPIASTKMMPYRFAMSREARWPDEIVLGSTEDHGEHVKMLLWE